MGVQNRTKIGPRSVSRAIMKQMQRSSKSSAGAVFLSMRRIEKRSKINKKSCSKRSQVDMPQEHPKMSQKVANMAAAWAQVGAMLGVRERPGTTEADPGIDPANHIHFSEFSPPGGRPGWPGSKILKRPNLYPDTYRYIGSN